MVQYQGAGGVPPCTGLEHRGYPPLDNQPENFALVGQKSVKTCKNMQGSTAGVRQIGMAYHRRDVRGSPGIQADNKGERRLQAWCARCWVKCGYGESVYSRHFRRRKLRTRSRCKSGEISGTPRRRFKASTVAVKFSDNPYLDKPHTAVASSRDFPGACYGEYLRRHRRVGHADALIAHWLIDMMRPFADVPLDHQRPW